MSFSDTRADSKHTHITIRLLPGKQNQWTTYVYGVKGWLGSRVVSVRDSRLCWCEDSGCFSPEVSETAAWNQYDRVRNDEVLQRTCLTSLSHLLSNRRISVFGHVARLGDVTPANMALQLHINVSLNRPPDRTWRRPPGRPWNKWVDQLRNDSTRPELRQQNITNSSVFYAVFCVRSVLIFIA